MTRLLTVLALLGSSLSTFAEEATPQAKSRSFHLNYSVSISGLQKFRKVEIWLPVPSSNAAQEVEIVKNSLATERYQVTHDRKYGNAMLYCSVDPAKDDPAEDEFSFDVKYLINRKEWRTDSVSSDGRQQSAKLTSEERQLFLEPNRLVPVSGKPLEFLPKFASNSTTTEQARSLYKRVNLHVSYDKSKPGYGNGDVLWVCDSRTGNCTDFHSLFISLARSQSIPARFEIGFPLPPERGLGKITGYHCWAWFFDPKCCWIPVDISEADKHPELTDYYFGNLTENRVGISIGRDIVLEPAQAGPPLNYFVYPYVEADGQALPAEQISWAVNYEDQR